MNDVIIGIGSNIDPKKNIEAAINLISASSGLIAKSKFVQTAPIGFKDQDDFLNGAVRVNTGQSMDELKDQLRKIEKTLGRKRGPNKFGPRTIDLDIILWNNEVIDDDFYGRDFIRNAVSEINPDLS
ncbi:MAG: 2-amino-4-hydroxy-6-hydroxymethyldihydropteridine diphosphokinase [Candidatus Omnitrophica bacterium]|nr:2-amino-4-hydroxy-6-hydroxymethyldihydropteridine diphosphokinase [Candidatus Omnitrophota bacterium]